jgi:hypothetical protein
MNQEIEIKHEVSDLPKNHAAVVMSPICGSAYVYIIFLYSVTFGKGNSDQTFFLFLGVGWDLSLFGTSATIWPSVPVPNDRWWWVWSSLWNDWQGEPNYSEKTCPRTTLSTTNPTWPDLGLNPDCRCGKPATNHRSYSTACICVQKEPQINVTLHKSVM